MESATIDKSKVARLYKRQKQTVNDIVGRKSPRTRCQDIGGTQNTKKDVGARVCVDKGTQDAKDDVRDDRLDTIGSLEYLPH